MTSTTISNMSSKVLWGEGLLLRPQHFQRHDEYHEQRLYKSIRAVNPYAWGVEELQIERAALGSNVLRILAHGMLDAGKINDKTTFYIAVPADIPTLELVDAVPLRVKVGAPDDVEKCVLSALPCPACACNTRRNCRRPCRCVPIRVISSWMPRGRCTSACCMRNRWRSMCRRECKG